MSATARLSGAQRPSHRHAGLARTAARASWSRMKPMRVLDLQPAHIGAGEDVAGLARGDGDVARSGRCPTAGRGGRRARAPTRARGRADDAQLGGTRSRGRGPASSNRAMHRLGVPEQLDGRRWCRSRRARRGGGRFGHARGVDIEADAAGTDQAAAEAAAAQQGRHVQEIAADAAAVPGGGQEADVARQRAEVADVVGQPLQLQGDAAQGLGARARLALPASASTTWQ